MNELEMTPKERVARTIVVLMSQKRVTGRQLAVRFGIGLRTVHTDMRLIMDAGLPIVGQSGVGYRWIERGVNA